MQGEDNKAEEKPSQIVNNLDNSTETEPEQKQPKPKKRLYVFVGLLILVVVAGIAIRLFLKNDDANKTVQSSYSLNKAVTSPSDKSVQTPNIPEAIDPINPAAIPIGTGRVSTTPEVGYVDLCNYTNGSIDTAEPTKLPWINTANNTWDSETKPSTEGSISWASSAYYTDNISGSTRTITTNDLPIDHDTGIYPISTSDPVYQWDHNPNSIKAQPTTWQLPANPTVAASPSCTNDGPVGILTDGVFLFNALDDVNRDAGATEIVDQWQGHPQNAGVYHHHTIPNFMLSAASAKASSTLVGYALDGYGIYIERDANGNLLTNANLDVCHGRTSEVMWNSKMTDMYHYDATLEYPYTVGCFHGTPINTKLSGNTNPQGNPQGRPAG